MPDSTDVTLPLAGDDYSLPSIIDDTIGTLLYTSGTINKENFKKAEGAVSREWQLGDTILGLYKVLEILGMGAFGKVYKVLHRSWNIPLAVKTLRAELAENRNHKEAFIKECQGWVNLGLHPNIVSCYYVRDLGGLPRIFLEYIEGGTLRNRMKKGEAQWKEILDYAIQCLDGMSFAHNKGLIHRDIKPENCLVTKRGELKITDFGIAAGLENIDINDEDKYITEKIKTEGAAGTPPYMPPEQWGKDYGDTGPWSDIYAFGVMLFEMCCKKRPFDSGQEHTGVVRLRHINEEPPSPCEVNKKIHKNLSLFILKCLKKKTRERFQTCDEARAELVKIYKTITGEDYGREKPQEAFLLADGLNNRAVSLMDLGLEEDALNIWKESFKADFLHIPSTFNSLLVRWRGGEISDLNVLKGLENILKERPDRKEVNYFMGLVHLERDSCKEAIESFKKAMTGNTGEEEIKKALREAEKRMAASTCYLKEISFDRNEEPEAISVNSSATRAFVSCRTKEQKDIYSINTSTTGNYHILDIEAGKWIKKRFCHPFWLSFISDDGKWGVSAGGKDYASLWDFEAGNLIKSFPSPPLEGRRSVTLSPDRKYFADGGKNGIIYIYDTYSGKCVKQFSGHRGPVSVLHFSRDGKHLISGSMEGEWTVTGVKKGKAKFNLWHIEAEKILRDFETPNEVEGANFSADGKIGVTINKNELKVWDTEKKKCINTCFIHLESGNPKKISLSEDGFLAMTYGKRISGNSKNIYFLWDTMKGICKRSLVASGSNFSLSSDGKMAFFWEKGWMMSFFHIWKINRENLGNFYSPFVLSFITDTKGVLKSQSRFSSLIEKAEKFIQEKNWNNAMDILSEARNLPGYEVNPEVLDLWQELYKNCRKIGIKSVKKIKTKVFDANLRLITISPDRKILLLKTIDTRTVMEKVKSGKSEVEKIKIWDVEKDALVKTLDSKNTTPIRTAEISSDGKFIALGHEDGFIELWDINRSFAGIFKDHTKSVNAISISRDNKWLLSGGGDKTIKLWDIASKRCLRTFKGHRQEIWSVYFSIDSQKIYSRDFNVIKIWDVPEGKCLETIGTSESAICLDINSEIALSGGTYERSVNNKNCLKLWDLSSARCIKSFPTGTNSYPIALSNNSRWAFCCGNIWDMKEEKLLKTLEISSMAFWSPDGRILLAGGSNSLSFWLIDWELEGQLPEDCNEEVLPYLENFVRYHIPYKEKLKQGSLLTEDNIKKALTREGKPLWNEEDLKELFETLRLAGYGYIKEESVKEELEKLKTEGIKEKSVKEEPEKLKAKETEEPKKEATDKDRDLHLELAGRWSFFNIRAALDNGADPNCCYNSGDTPLHRIIKNSKKAEEPEKIISLLIERGAKLNRKSYSSGLTPVELAGKRSYFTPVLEEILLEKITSAVEISPEGIIEEFEISPIHFLSIKNDEEELETVISQGNVNDTDILGNSPLHYAALSGNKNIAELLIKKRANVQIKNKFERTPLHYCAKKGNSNVMGLLLEKNIDLNIKDPVGWTPLHFAAKSGSKKTVELLLKNGAKPDLNNSDYENPLEISISDGAPEVIELLAEKEKDKNDSKTLNLAVKHNRKEVLELLLEKGFNINGQDAAKRTPLHISAEEGNLEMAKFLLNKGADLDLLWYEIITMTKTRVENMGWHLINGSNLVKLSSKVERGKLNYIKSSKLMNRIHSGQKMTDYLRSGVVFIKEEDVKHILSKMWPGHLKFIKPYLNRNIFGREFFEKLLLLGYGHLHSDIFKKKVNVIDYSTGDITRIKSDTNVRVPYEKSKVLGGFKDKEMPRSVIKEKLKKSGYNNDEIAVVLEHAKPVYKYDSIWRVPLHYAVCKGHKDMVKLFVESGADVTLKDKSRKTPFQLTEDETIRNILLKGYERKEKEERGGGGIFSFLGKLFGI